MRFLKIVSMFIAGVLVLGLAGCVQPNLEVEPLADLTGPISFCRGAGGDLDITIVNTGNKEAPASTTEVEFTLTGGNQTVTLNTPKIDANASRTVSTTFPLGCFNPDCDFEIRLDDGGDIDESNENDNVEQGRCIG